MIRLVECPDRRDEYGDPCEPFVDRCEPFVGPGTDRRAVGEASADGIREV